ncbi:MAG: PhoU domain-containing protein [Planctomycetota bacterium]
MFDWMKNLGGEAPGLHSMLERFAEMISNGRHMFDLASNAVMGGADAEVVRSDLFETDKKINHGEQQLRRDLVVHATVHGSSTFPTCLVLMSIAKDAERIGDYCKNLYDIAERRPLRRDDPDYDEFKAIKEETSTLLGELLSVYVSQDETAAKTFLLKAEKVEDRCDRYVDHLVRTEGGSVRVVQALGARHMKRIAAHAKNIVTSVVMPIDKLDYFDEH